MAALFHARQEPTRASTSSFTPAYSPLTSSRTTTSHTPTISSFSVTSSTTSANVVNTTIPSSTASSLPESRHGVSNGALAGAVVGSIVGTALVALIAAVLFFRFRRRPTPNPQTPSPPDQGLEFSKLPTSQTRPIAASRPVRGEQFPPLDLVSFIPPPADDQSVSARIHTFFDHVSLHVDNYYAPGSHEPTPLTAEATIQIETYRSPLIPGPLATILANRRARRAVLTHVLARTLLQAIQPGGPLYPPFCESQQIDVAAPVTGQDNATFAWRMLTARLHAKSLDTTSGVVQGHIIALAGGFTQAFAPFHNPQLSEADRQRHLSSVVRECAELSVWLFTQPCSFNFVWTSSPGSIVIFPAVVKTSDEQGNPLPVSQKMVEETTAQL
ncbi:hypothetical protein BO94DRAFT_579956 [Aspergillus sclerotioniger CBS 115572]|uniref:Uncharacterized protein n=1 Tax=Aspergillus sclerotioniger CBS 115572 TaxID=1450535 RepID=A0A317USY8_9EURO|nr:hypothetical protein BO94DRAFT_579956 [Aspergillus sclerotioniger CBS 115572]PWY64725.1 hypothetical protein BO94DRAFT_579956 [Aspergillus sclerotioniger CBS 115572]